MRPIIITSIAIFAALTVSVAAKAQTPEEQRKAEKEFYESIDREKERLTDLLDLEDWQVFYVDSILTHDYKALEEELQDLRNKKVSNADLYYEVQDRFKDKIYYAYQKIFDEKQWAKYLKSGAGREKQAREKKQAKAEAKK